MRVQKETISVVNIDRAAKEITKLAAKHDNAISVYFVINCAESKTNHSIRQNHGVKRLVFLHRARTNRLESIFPI